MTNTLEFGSFINIFGDPSEVQNCILENVKFGPKFECLPLAEHLPHTLYLLDKGDSFILLNICIVIFAMLFTLTHM